MTAELYSQITFHKKSLTLCFIIAAFTGLVLFIQIGRISVSSERLKVSFLSVGEGDSALLHLPGNVQILIDAGRPGGGVVRELEKMTTLGDRYIDIVVISHVQADHFGGLTDLLEGFRVGAVIWNGSAVSSPGFESIKDILYKRGIPLVSIMKGSRIIYNGTAFSVLSPARTGMSATNENENSLVLKVNNAGMSYLFTGDIGSETENRLVQEEIRADILKIAHHGSKYSSNADFLKSVAPKVAVVSTGKNAYGHPHEDVLKRVEQSGAMIFRTDIYGTITIQESEEKISIFSKRQVESSER